MLKLSKRRVLIIGALFFGLFFNLIIATPAFSTPELTARPCPPRSIDESVRVAYVHDGDTLKLQDGRKIRLIGINTPEVSRKNRPAQAFAYQARDALRQLVKQTDFKVSLSFGVDRQDKYNRTLAHLYLADGTNIQARLIELGLATAFTTPPNDRQADCYRHTEAVAIKSSRGIWSLDEYGIKASTQLTRHDRGFRRIQGRVERIKQSKKALWIHMLGEVRIRIDATDLYNFDVYSLQQLEGKKIRVRGWLHAKKKGHFMMLRHPSSLITQIK